MGENVNNGGEGELRNGRKKDGRKEEKKGTRETREEGRTSNRWKDAWEVTRISCVEAKTLLEKNRGDIILIEGAISSITLIKPATLQ